MFAIAEENEHDYCMCYIPCQMHITGYTAIRQCGWQHSEIPRAMKLTPTLESRHFADTQRGGRCGQCGVYAMPATTCLSLRLFVRPRAPLMSGPDSWAHLLCVYVQVPLCVCACVWIKIVIRRVSLGNFFSCFDWFVIYCRCLRFAYSLFTLTISLLLLLAPLVLLLLRWVFDFDF